MAEIDTDTPKGRAQLLFRILEKDRNERLLRFDNYIQGVHSEPYMPDNADAEYHLLAERCITNYVPLLVRAPVQGCYVDGFRSGKDKPAEALIDDPSWDHWQRSNLDSKQTPIYYAAAAYGHAFALTYKDERSGQTKTKGLSPLRTAAIYDDPASDVDPVAALHVTRWPSKKRDGKAQFWDSSFEYAVTFRESNIENIALTEIGETGAEDCPVTRFAIEVDLDGRTTGIVEQIIPLQDRLNQTVFDLLIAQTYGSFKVRTVTGMAPPLEQEAIYGEDGELLRFQPKVGDDGNPIPRKFQGNGKTWHFAEDPEVKFGQLDETPLDGYIAALKDVSERLSATTQTPPTYLLGQIANLSAEALNAAETTFNRKVQSFQHSFGEAWERVFRIAAQIEGDTGRAEDVHGEVIWRDMESRSLSQTADALGKLGQSLGVPLQGLWEEVPGVTQQKLAHWIELSKEQDSQAKLADAMLKASQTSGRMPRQQSQAGATPLPSNERAPAKG